MSHLQGRDQLSEDLLDACRYRWVHLGGESKVVGCFAKVCMPKIGLQQRKEGRKILAFLHPAFEAMDCEAVP